jgi:hypothetical protein
VRIVHRYILREILVPFALGISVFTFVLLIARLLRLIEMVVESVRVWFQLTTVTASASPTPTRVTIGIAPAGEPFPRPSGADDSRLPRSRLRLDMPGILLRNAPPMLARRLAAEGRE